MPEPRALSGDEMGRLVDDFRAAAARAKQAGFDGVEIHAANGYLLDQLLRDGTNRRTDEWGGTIENRMRLPLAVADAVAEVWSADRVGVRVSPVSDAADMHDSDPQALFTAFARQLGSRGLAYLRVVEGRIFEDRDAASFDTDVLRTAFGGVVIGNNRYDRALAERIAEGHVDLVAFGRPFISNPDLVVRLRRGRPSSRGTRRPSMAEAAKATLTIRRLTATSSKGTLGPTDRPRGPRTINRAMCARIEE